MLPMTSILHATWIAIVFGAAVSAGAGSKVVINPDGVLQIDGTKTFHIGFIMPPWPDARTPDGKNGIDELADAGATFIRTGIVGPTSLWNDNAFARERSWQDAA